MKRLSKLLIFFLLGLSGPVYAQATAEQVQPGYLTSMGCTGGNPPCFVPYNQMNPMPVMGNTSGTSPIPPNTNISGTISSSNVFQQIATAVSQPGPPRNGCAVQNNGTHTMYVYIVGSSCSSATESNSVELAAGQSASCWVGGANILQDNICVAGTSGDAFYAATQ